MEIIPILSFATADPTRWIVVNDGVMGGVSQSRLIPTEDGTGLFTGQLSLENNGGFASVRLNPGRRDLSAAQGLELRVRGDGREYQVRLSTDTSIDGVAYRALFRTRDAEWTTLRVPFSDFLPSFRGRILQGVDPLDTAAIEQVAFLLADGRSGSFSLEIESVDAYVENGLPSAD